MKKEDSINYVLKSLVETYNLDDVLNVVGQWYNYSELDVDKRTIRCSSSFESDELLEIVLSKDHSKVQKAGIIFNAQNLSSKEQSKKERNLSRHVANYVTTNLTPKEPQVYRMIVTSNRKLIGHFRHGNDFQLIPVPADAPQPKYEIGDFPFIIEYQIEECNNTWVNVQRRAQRGQEIAYCLNLLCNSRVKSMSSSEYKWGLIKREDKHETHYFQTGYFLLSDERSKDSRGFTIKDIGSDISTHRLTVTPYRTPHIVGEDNLFYLPSELEHYLEVVSKLSSEKKQKFDRAIHWLHSAELIRQISVSSSFLALVTSIECFIDGDRTVAKFKEFVDSHIPDYDVDSVSNFYNMRSEIIHGVNFFRKDNNKSSDLSGLSHHQRFSYDSLSILVRAIIVAWLDKNIESGA